MRTIKKRKLITMLPFIIILAVICILLLSELFRSDLIMADHAIENPVVKKNFELIPFLWTVSIVGGCIGLTLVYVSWRKYQAEHKAEEQKQLENNKQKKSQL